MAYDFSTPIFVKLILEAYEKESLVEIKMIWRMKALVCMIQGHEMESFDVWIKRIREDVKAQEETGDTEELLEKIKKDLGKG